MTSVAARLRPFTDPAIALGALALDLATSWDTTRPVPGPDEWVVPGYAFAGNAFLVARRRAPFAVLAVLVLHNAFAAVALPAYGPLVGVWVALYTVAAHRPLRHALAGLALTTLPLATSVADAVGRQEPGRRAAVMVGTAAAFTLFTVAAFAVGRWAAWSRRQRVVVAELAAAAAVRDERARIARDVHDVVAHTVTVMALQAAGAARRLRDDPDAALEALVRIDALSVQATTELGRLVRVLPGNGGDGEHRVPGLEDVRSLVAGLTEGRPPVTLQVRGAPCRVEPGVDVAAYRIVQEALTNAVRHGAPDVPVTVEVEWSPDVVRVGVTNGLAVGRSRRRPGTGRGLLGLQERARSVGGTVEAGPDGGVFRVEARLPSAPA